MILLKLELKKRISLNLALVKSEAFHEVYSGFTPLITISRRLQDENVKSSIFIPLNKASENETPTITIGTSAILDLFHSLVPFHKFCIS